MRTKSTGLITCVGGIAAALVFGLTGCGADSKDTNAPTATAGTSGVQIEVGNTINYGSFGTTADVDCAEGKSLNVGGSNNTLTVKGTCASVSISGADNKITLTKVDKDLSVLGIDNTVTYSDGVPKVEDLGSGNSIKKG
jgi:hypothetical protein